MNPSHNYVVRCTQSAIFSLFVLTGCNASQPNSQHNDAISRSAPIVASQGEFKPAIAKPGAPVTLTHDYDGHTDNGQVESFTAKLSATQPLDTITVQLSAPAGLLVNTETEISVSNFGNDILDIPITVQSVSDGKFYINLFVESKSGSRSMNRSFAIPIDVGEASQQKSATSKDADAVPIVELPAEETVMPKN